MAEPLTPLSLPPTPPELASTALAFSGPLRTWTGRMLDWVGQIVRVLKDKWTQMLAQINGLLTRMAAVETRVTTLETRVKDTLTFPVEGPLAVGTKVTLPLVVPVTGTIVEVRGDVETAPTGASLLIDVNKAGTSIWAATQANRLTIAAGALSGARTVFDTAAVTKDDKLSIDIDQVGSTVPGSDLVVQVRIR